ncbi:PQQ-binding-like beta-propeller repeat protein [Tamlana sp. 2201CG12-4]|uniref:PQQ-binding-like beta-propeller repeat protein n=1 Tax=Tamlana sp. 2201CG12-4 TaxID=3112582 RepID=UPI002DB8A062|nr:PQQ-binding-like beta-propeller repeat protein [Tamlana sp. 2201CG12-4]MEC3907891.1 PQQ-binding-like beta-propeller repeat protein [Tamlana sp. 2201CG12-4]
MKIQFKIVFHSLLVLMMLVSCNTIQETRTFIPGSKNQWPMSGGPDGSWKVKTDLQVPTEWSVRTGKNIKWKKTLPEGGQSGIAIWKDKLFITINPPNDNPKHAEILNRFKITKAKYDTLFDIEVKRLQNDNKLRKLKKALEAPEQEWNNFLAKHKHYQSATSLERVGIEENLMRRNDIGKAYEKVLKDYKAYVHGKSDALNNAYDELNRLKKARKGGAKSKNIVLLCINSETGETLWERTVKGTIESQYNYGFSDATTPCPITDGKNVWAINASGGMACYTLEGQLIWERTWVPSTGGKPFNKQFDSILFEDLILNAEPPEDNDATRNKSWNYLHAFNKDTGERVWVTEEALTHYNTPVLGETSDGNVAVLIGRGGPHEVPERPVGLSLISLDKSSQGQALWHWEPEEENAVSGWGALSTQHWDTDKASWFFKGDSHLTIDTKTGKLIAKKRLNVVDQYHFDIKKGNYIIKKDVALEHHQNQRHCNMSSDDYLFYMVRYQPYIARHNVKSGKNEHLEVPTEVDENGDLLWGSKEKNDGLNSKGQLNAFDARTRGDGFQKCFLGSPTMINNFIYFTNALGVVYVIDANAETFDQSALVAVNDLGPRGKTWSVNSLSFANGKIYHRTMKELICIGK